MFRSVRLESQKELFLKSNNNNTLRNILDKRKEKPVTDKITNISFHKQTKPQINEISSRQKYLDNIAKNSQMPYIEKNNSNKKMGKIRRSIKSHSVGKNNENAFSEKNDNDYDDNLSISRTHSGHSLTFRSFSHFKNLKKKGTKTEYKEKRSKSFFADRLSEKENILKTTNNSRIRKLYSMSSDIFNLDNCSTNLIQNKTFYKDKDKNNNKLMKSSKGLLERGNCEFSIEKARSINIKRMKKLEEKVENKKFNKLSLLLNKDFANTDFVPFLHKMPKKTNASNIESVNYDIISNKTNNLYDKYNKLSNKKSTFLDYDNYEIVIPKSYSGLDSSKLKNLLHAQGIHFYNFHEQVSIGEKGRYQFRIRKPNLNDNNNTINNNNKKIENLSKKLINVFNVKLKKNGEKFEKKISEVTREYGPEDVANHLQNDDNEKRLIKR